MHFKKGLLVLTAGFLVLIGLAATSMRGPVTISRAASAVAGTHDQPLAVQNINVQNFSFSPANVTVPAGTTVHWNFVVGVHSSTSGACCTPDGTWDSGILGSGATFDRAFSTPGVYPYFCQVHGAAMTGTITVSNTTAAGATLSGRVVDTQGRGIRAGTVSLTDEEGVTRSVRIGRYGYYMIEEVPTGHTYIITAAARRYRFTPQVISVTDNVSGLDLIPSQGARGVQMDMSKLHDPVCSPVSAAVH